MVAISVTVCDHSHCTVLSALFILEVVTQGNTVPTIATQDTVFCHACHVHNETFDTGCYGILAQFLQIGVSLPIRTPDNFFVLVEHRIQLINLYRIHV